MPIVNGVKQNSTNYVHPQETNLDSLHRAMQYDGNGQPVLRTTNANAASVTSFGEPVAIPITPIIQIDGLYGLNHREFETFIDAGGSADVTNTKMRVQTGTTVGAFAVIRSIRTVRYRPGQGALSRFTVSFDTPVTGYTQRAGFFNIEQALMVGYDGTNFGVLRQNGGKTHIEILTVTGGASTAGNVTVTLDGTAYVVPVTIDTAGINAAEISEWFQDPVNSVTDWTVEHCDGVVHFIANRLGPKAGAFSFAAGSTGMTATPTTEQAGVADVLNWTYQSDFSIDTLDGNGPSGIVIDPTMMNIFQISFQWLGVGVIRFCMEHPDTGQILEFHRETFANQTSDVHIDNPSLKLGYVVASTGGSGTNVTVTGASMMGAIEGEIKTTRLPTAVLVAQAESPNLAADTLHHGLTLHNRLTYAGKLNTHELLIKDISVAFDTNPNGSPVEILLFSNFDSLPGPSVNLIVNDDNSAAFYNNVTATLTQGTNYPIYAFFATGGTPVSVNVENLRITVSPNEEITVAIRATDPISRKSIAFTFIED